MIRATVFFVTLAAAPTGAQRVDSPTPFWCTAGTCFMGQDRCDEFLQMRSDTGQTAGACREQRTAHCVTYYDSREDGDYQICYSAAAGCARQRRDLQTYNRRIRYRYEEVSACIVATYRPLPPLPPPTSVATQRNDFVRSLLTAGEVQISDRFFCDAEGCMPTTGECVIHERTCEETDIAYCFVVLETWTLRCFPSQFMCAGVARETTPRAHVSICLPYGHDDGARSFSDLNPSPSVSPP